MRIVLKSESFLHFHVMGDYGSFADFCVKSFRAFATLSQSAESWFCLRVHVQAGEIWDPVFSVQGMLFQMETKSRTRDCSDNIYS